MGTLVAIDKGKDGDHGEGHQGRGRGNDDHRGDEAAMAGGFAAAMHLQRLWSAGVEWDRNRDGRQGRGRRLGRLPNRVLVCRLPKDAALGGGATY